MAFYILEIKIVLLYVYDGEINISSNAYKSGAISYTINGNDEYTV